MSLYLQGRAFAEVAKASPLKTEHLFKKTVLHNIEIMEPDSEYLKLFKGFSALTEKQQQELLEFLNVYHSDVRHRLRQATLRENRAAQHVLRYAQSICTETRRTPAARQLLCMIGHLLTNVA